MRLTSFDKMRLLGQPSRINSRSECDTSSVICGIPFEVPVIASAMTSIFSEHLLINMNNCGTGAIQPRKDTSNFKAHYFDTERTFINSSLDSAMYTAEQLSESLRQGHTKYVALSIEINNGYMHRLADKIKQVKDKYPELPIFAGAVFTPEGVEFLGDAGADVVLVGVGVSTACTTTNKTGMGLPNGATAMICGQTAYKTALLGGIREIGDVAKAIALGIDLVYIGHLLRGCIDSGDRKAYWGMASSYEKRSNNYIEGQKLDIQPQDLYSHQIVRNIKDGLQSAMSMADSAAIIEFQSKVKFAEIN